jgi:hypothetical protein
MAHRIAENTVERAPLHVLQRGSALVPDYRALIEAGARRHHGAHFDKTLGPEDEFEDPKTGEKFRGHHGGFVRKVDHVVTIEPSDPHYQEYVRHLRDGDLWAAGLATAQAAGVAFQPDFGDEHPETAAGKEATAYAAELKKREAENLKSAREAEASAKAAQTTTAPAAAQASK